MVLTGTMTGAVAQVSCDNGSDPAFINLISGGTTQHASFTTMIGLSSIYYDSPIYFNILFTGTSSENSGTLTISSLLINISYQSPYSPPM